LHVIRYVYLMIALFFFVLGVVLVWFHCVVSMNISINL
jgi:hypothetical protein